MSNAIKTAVAQINNNASMLHRRVSLRTKAWASKKIEAALAAFFAWALSKYAVQRVVADAFSGSTPMCRVLRDAIEGTKPDIDADDVNGLDRYIESSMEACLRDFEVDADSVQGLDKMISEALESEVAEELTQTVIEEIRNRLRN